MLGKAQCTALPSCPFPNHQEMIAQVLEVLKRDLCVSFPILFTVTSSLNAVDSFISNFTCPDWHTLVVSVSGICDLTWNYLESCSSKFGSLNRCHLGPLQQLLCGAFSFFLFPPCRSECSFLWFVGITLRHSWPWNVKLLPIIDIKVKRVFVCFHKVALPSFKYKV